MAAAGYNVTETELDDVHRLLPPEILEDIGIAANAANALRTPDIVEELAARLAAVLGGKTGASQSGTLPPPVKVATSSSYQHCRVPLPEVHAQRKRAEAWMLAENGCSLPRVAPPAPRPLLVGGAVPLPSAKPSSGGGTGVFMPRTGAYAYQSHHTTRGSKASRQNGVGLGQQQCRRRRSEEDEMRRRRRQQQLRFHAHANVAAAAMLEQQLRMQEQLECRISSYPATRMCF
ncbi:hypothetical protein BS78_01G353600 [Paspalum vaginatum]|nr:hypothetical protein BS78_01G353600 [Paspalum vaginatum]